MSMNTVRHRWFILMLLGALSCSNDLLSKRKSCESSCESSCSSSCESSNSCESSCEKVCNASCDSECAFGRTIFIPRSQTTDSTLDLALGNYHFYHHAICPEDRAFFHIQASYFHKESTKSRKLADYFLGKNCLAIRENGTGDIGSLWVDLMGANGTSFSSNLSIAPRRTIDGGFFNFYFDFNNYFSGCWLSIAFAAFRAEHNLCLKENDIQNEGIINGIATGVDAFNNPAWSAGKFSCRRLHRTAVDDVQLKFGYNYFFCNQDHIGIYFVGIAPTGCRYRNEFIFEPFVGLRHGAVGVGLNGDYTLLDRPGHGLIWMYDVKYRYVLPACERRSFDLCRNGRFSRYLQVATCDQPSFSMPGINFFTQEVRVNPRSQIDLWTALHYNYCEYNFEVGYNLWWRDSERVCIKKPLCPNIGIYDLVGDCNGNPVSASQARICQSVTGDNKAPSDATFVTLSNRDLNLLSGTAPRALTNTVYGALSYNSEVWCMPVMLGVVGSYEFARCDTAFEQWGVMVKTAMSF